MDQALNDIIFTTPIVVGVSSGPDSMCLLDIIEKKTKDIIVCHINHNVRKESKEEELYLINYCRKHNLIFESMTITSYEENNFENEARKKRYAFYEEILNKYHSKYLFLAHHGDDLIETVLMKIVRGSNIDGYAGIKKINKVKDYYIVRPLLDYTKEDIINYNKDNNIKYYIDKTNNDTSYTRNRYRKNILPLLKEEDKSVHKKFLKYSIVLQEYSNYMQREIERNINNVYKDNTIYLDKLLELDTFLIKNILYYILNNTYNNENNIITEKHIDSIISIINSTKPNLSINLPYNKKIVKEYNKLIIKDKTDNIKDYKIEVNNKIEINNMTIEKIKEINSDGNNVCRLNSSNIKLPLYIRNRKNGDTIILKGSNYHKKIKDIFIEKKIPKDKRDSYPLLVDSEDNILWIPNIKKSKFCCVNNENYDIILFANEREENDE